MKGNVHHASLAFNGRACPNKLWLEPSALMDVNQALMKDARRARGLRRTPHNG